MLLCQRTLRSRKTLYSRLGTRTSRYGFHLYLPLRARNRPSPIVSVTRSEQRRIERLTTAKTTSHMHHWNPLPRLDPIQRLSIAIRRQLQYRDRRSLLSRKGSLSLVSAQIRSGSGPGRSTTTRPRLCRAAKDLVRYLTQRRKALSS